MKIKYPRTPHLPFSETITSDDRRLKDCSIFKDKQVVITVKMDGENTTMYSDGIHARSLDSRDHASRSYVKGIHARVQNDIPYGWRICGENLFAMHSIHYTNLPDYFMVFSVWNERNECLSWRDTKEFCAHFNLEYVPVIAELIFDEKMIRNLKLDPTKYEGYVVRNADSFHYDDFSKNVAKYVRANHVQSNSHWMNSAIVKNILG